MSALSRFLCCCFVEEPQPEIVTPRGAEPGNDDLNGTPSTASCTTPAGPGSKFIFDDDGTNVIGLNNSGVNTF